MKKIFVKSIAIIIPMAASAQLKHTTIHEDELTGKPKTEVYTSGNMTFYDDGKNVRILAKCHDHIFTKGQFFIAGFYDRNDSLIIKADDWFNMKNDNGQYAELSKNVGTENYVPEIMGESPRQGKDYSGKTRYGLTTRMFLDYLLNGDGYIRFITTTYGNYEYEEVVKCNNYKQ